MTVSWAFDGEATQFTVAVLKSLETVHAVVPALWPFEVANVLRTAERRGRMDAAAQAAFLERLRLLPIATLDDDLRRAACAADVPLVGAA